MTSGSTLVAVRVALYELMQSVLPAGVALGWDKPKLAEQTDGDDGGRRAVWLHAASEITAELATMGNGWTETYEQIIVIQCLPTTGSVTSLDADYAADELLTLIVNAVADDPRLEQLTPDVEGWSLVVRYGGANYRNGLIDGLGGYAAGFDVRITVEATRCS